MTCTAKSYTTDLSQNQFLQALDFNFEFHCRADLWVIDDKARRDLEPLYGILKTLSSTIDFQNKLLLGDTDEQTQAAGRLNIHFLIGLWEKINANVTVLENLRTTTCYQVLEIIHIEGTPPGSEPLEVQVKSFFCPGKSLVFLDDMAEYDLGFSRFNWYV
ncbi:MAG: hypothetical protein Q9207_005804 [Kuettlingeria erythrocarpa]